MKLNAEAREFLKEELRKRTKESGYSFAEIGRKAGVSTSQVSRICRSASDDPYAFKTLSPNVVQICKALGISKINGAEIDFVDAADPAGEAAHQHLQDSLLEVWDRTPEDAERLARFLKQLAKLRRTNRNEAERE